MVDSLGWRMKFGVIAPSTNTSVQPEFDAMRPRGVTNHFARIHIPENRVETDEDFLVLMNNIRAELMNAVDRVITCRPDYIIMGMSAETFWDGLEGSVQLQNRIESHSKLKVAMGSDACQAALKAYGKDIKRIGVITPYMPVGDANVTKFFTDCGFEVLALKGLKCKSPVLIAHVSERELRDAINEVNVPGVQAIVQVGTNLAMARLAGIAEFWLDKPVIAINTATYWWALRQNGITDKVDGYGSLLLDH
jgi:maleate isomerase